MNPRRKKGLTQIIVGVVILVVSFIMYWYGNERTAVVASFAECAAAGYPVMESYPRQCKTPEGETFREDIGNELEKDDLIRIAEPRPNAIVTSPLTVKGMARGTWFFEASFPVKLIDANGKVLVQVPAQAKGEWMTTEFVPFEVTLTFELPQTSTGTLVLEKDNPSGLPEHADELRVPVSFAAPVEPGNGIGTTPSPKACVISGCSNQICGEEEMMSTCEFKEEYACYKAAKCERQTSGTCGWTETPELRACVNNAR